MTATTIPFASKTNAWQQREDYVCYMLDGFDSLPATGCQTPRGEIYTL